ncbi:MAG: hypothetical protein CVU95_06815 [Firmicutes bacterium HGW-Firmicutes-2]|jgi:hypothetical protein|nr:MAG: hypothetical protein CVU95_06815 [Firmicutes bacterium HGW-Firmicutes-2]
MTVAEKNINALQKNAFGTYIIDYLALNKSVNCSMLIESKYNSSNEWKWGSRKLDFNKHSNFIMFGIGNGYMLENIYKNMSNESTITVIEKYNNVLSNCLGNKDLSHILKEDRLCIICNDELDTIYKMLDVRLRSENIVYNTPNFQFVTMPYMKSQDEPYINKVMYNISSQIIYHTISYGNDINDVLEGFDHIVDNWNNMLYNKGINDFKDQYSNIPAIIVSAGPSLDKNIHYLRSAYKKSLILTVDATADKVMKLGVIPDSISTIERPDKMFSIFYEKMDIPNESVFMGPPVVTHKIIDKFDKTIFVGREGELITKMMTNLFQYDSIEIGMSCSHIPFAFAKYIGANPIIFIGQDLSFGLDGSTHYKDVESYVTENVNKSDLKTVVGQNGEILQTNSAYYSFLLWFENEIAKTKDTTFINATEGGARIKGTLQMTLKEAINNYCSEEIIGLGKNYARLTGNQYKDTSEITKQGKKVFEKMMNTTDDVKEFLTTKLEQVDEMYKLPHKLDSHIDLLNEIYSKLSLDTTLRFIVQPYYVSFYRKTRQFPVKMSESEWNLLTFEIINFMKKTVNIMVVLKEKFGDYLSSITGGSNEKSD